MRRILIFTAVILGALTASCAGQKSFYEGFVEKFPIKEVPLSIPHDCSDRSANDPSNLTETELTEILNLDTDVWQNTDDYYYNTGCRFDISNCLEAILYFRSYLPFDFAKQKSECVLAVFCDDQLTDTLIIQGSIGDDLSLKSTITKDLEINILFEKLALDENGETHITTNAERYSINGKGEIIRIEVKKK